MTSATRKNRSRRRRVLGSCVIVAALSLLAPATGTADPGPGPDEQQVVLDSDHSTPAPTEANSVEVEVVPEAVQDATARLETIEQDTNTLAERHDAALALLSDARGKRERLEVEISEQSERVERLQKTFANLVNTQLQTSDFGATFGVVAAVTSDEFLGQLSRLTSVSAIIEGQMTQFASEQARLNQLKGQYDAAVATIESEVDHVAELQQQLVEAEMARQMVLIAAGLHTPDLYTADFLANYPGAFLFPTTGTPTDPFGWRIHPITGLQQFHTGTDIANRCGTTITAVSSGVVRRAAYGWNHGLGNMVEIDHGDGLRTVYAHLSELAVGVNQSVNLGQVIATMGSTGMSTGCHLHLEATINGEYFDALTLFT